ncbi:hypothetical protein EBU94_01230 [bacterium]|nr:hypothetical protein [bacterium]
MRKDYKTLLTIILVGGTAFSWTTVYQDFSRFYNLYGDIFKIEGCDIPNPVTTPCFYGAIAFAISLGLLLFRKYKSLFYLLVFGTIFAWSNFLYEFYKFYSTTGVKTSCSGVVTDNVFTTPCFYGALIYLLALITIIFSRRKSQKES